MAVSESDDNISKHAIPIAPDDAFEALSNSRRRRTILSLARSDSPVTASDLAVEIVAIEEGIDPRSVNGEDRTRVYVPLIQTHLPRLDGVGAIEFDERSKQVRPTAATEALAAHIREITTACYEPDQEADNGE